MLIFLLAFITAQTVATATLSPSIESLAVMRFRAFAANIVGHVPFRENVANKLCRVRNTLRGLIPQSLLAFLNVFLDRKTDIREYAI